MPSIFADTVLDYFDSGAGPIPGPYGIDNLNNSPVPVTPDIIVDNNPTTGALSLPTNSSVTVGFSNALIPDRPGNDISVQEFEGAGEQAQVYVSSDFDIASPDENFVLLGTAGTGNTSFDLASIRFTDTVEAVRIVGLNNGGTSPGFDVANVQALQPSSQTVEVKLRTFIPSEAINVTAYPSGFVNGGDNRAFSSSDDASFRSSQSVSLNFNSLLSL